MRPQIQIDGQRRDLGNPSSALLRTFQRTHSGACKSEVAAPLTSRYWRDIYKAKYEMLGRLPDAKPKTEPQKRGWKRFTQWIRYHRPPFPETPQFNKKVARYLKYAATA